MYKKHYEDPSNKSYIRYKKKFAKPGVHVPSKKESKLLRKIMAETGMSETEVREHKKYRKMLSDTQKSKSKYTEKEREERDIMKMATKQLGLAKEHPKVKALFRELWKKYCPHIPL